MSRRSSVNLKHHGRGFLLLAGAAFASAPSASAEKTLFETGTVLCSNFDPRNRSCRTITTVTAMEDGQRFARSRRMVAMPEENLLLETQEIAEIDGHRVCQTGSSAPPTIAPDHYSYAPVLLSVYEDKRDKKLARGVCHEYQKCGSGWHVYVSYDDAPEPQLVSFTTVFGPDDSGSLGLSLRYREFGYSERIGTDCEPLKQDNPEPEEDGEAE